MNHENGRFPTVDRVLEQFSRVTVPLDVEQRLEARVQEFCRQPQMPPPRPASDHRWRRPIVRAAVAAGLAAMLMAALFVAFGNHDAWAQVAQSMRLKPWVRLTLQYPRGVPVPEGAELPEAWFSAEHKVAARRMKDAAQFIDFAGQNTYEYDPQKKTVTITATRDNDNVEFGHIETLLRLVCEGDRQFELPESPIQIVGRSRRNVTDDDRRWTEFTFKCHDPRRAVENYQVTFRVDLETGLPVEMRSTEKFAANDPAAERTFAIDFPETGPRDIYALGVPRTALIVERRRKTENGKEIKDFLAAYVKARAKPLEPFSMTMLLSFSRSPQEDLADVYHAYRGRGDGKSAQVEEVDRKQLQEVREKHWAKKITRPDGVDWATWWREQIAGLTSAPSPRGDELLPHHVGYPTELLDLGPSPVDNPDCHVTLDRQPKSGPEGTVLLTIHTETQLGYNECFFWIAPERDYMVLRHEIHFSKEHTAWHNSTQIIDKVEQSPNGRWYATLVRSGRIEKHGDDLPAGLVAPNLKQPQTGMEIGPVTTNVLRYFVDFE